MAVPGNDSRRNGWTSNENLAGHFEDHGQGHDSIDDYHSDAWDNINDPNTISRSAPDRQGRMRTGHFNTRDGRLTITTPQGRKISFFIPYPRRPMERRRRYFDENFPEQN